MHEILRSGSVWADVPLASSRATELETAPKSVPLSNTRSCHTHIQVRRNQLLLSSAQFSGIQVYSDLPDAGGKSDLVSSPCAPLRVGFNL